MRKTGQRTKYNKFTIVIVISIIVCIVAGCACYFLYRQSIRKMTGAIKNTYNVTKEEEYKKRYDEFYNASKEKAKAKFHSSNRINIQIGKIQEEENLEVLRVSDVEYVIWDKDDKDENGDKYEITSWRKVPAIGVFTVNLKASEIIKDNERKYVLVRVPSPQLTEFTLDDEHKETLFFKTGLFDKTPGDGADLTYEQDKKAAIELEKSMSTNADYYEQAKISTKTSVRNLVMRMNPEIENLIVEVEFLDEEKSE